MDLAGPHHGGDPLVLLTARAVLLGDDPAVLVLRERRLRETTLALGQLPAPDARAGSTLADRLGLSLPPLLRGLPTRNEISGSTAKLPGNKRFVAFSSELAVLACAVIKIVLAKAASANCQ